MTDKAIWTGASGRQYEYQVFDARTNWNDVPGNYIFAALAQGRWRACYIGQTESFKNRLPNHESWACAAQNGATHVHARVNRGGEQARKAEEADLIASNQPPCNIQLKQSRNLGLGFGSLRP